MPIRLHPRLPDRLPRETPRFDVVIAAVAADLRGSIVDPTARRSNAAKRTIRR